MSQISSFDKEVRMQLLLSLLAYSRFFINNAADFDRAVNYNDLFFSSDVELVYLYQLSLENAQVDCLMHTITAESPPFDVVSNVTIRNCVFKLRNGLSNNFFSSALINSTVISDGAVAVLRRIKDSFFYGLRSSTAQNFSGNVANTTVVGCSFQLGFGQAGAKAALFGYITKSRFQNTFFNLTVTTVYQTNVAGLTVSCYNTSFTRIRVISKVTAHLRNRAPSASGFIVESNNVGLIDSDFLIRMNVSYLFSKIAAVIVEENMVDAKIFNISLVTTINMAKFEPTDAKLPASNVGTLFASTYGATYIRAVSAFVDIIWNSSTQCASIILAGLTGYSLQGSIKLFNCYVFGTIAIYNINSEFYYLSGMSSYTYHGSVMDSCVFNGAIKAEAVGWSFAFIGALDIRIYGIEMINSHAICDFNIKFAKQRTIYLGGLIADAAGGTIQSSTINTSINLEYNSYSVGLKVGGLLSEIDDNEVRAFNLSGQAQITVKKKAGYITGGEIALLFGAYYGSASNCLIRGSITIETPQIGLSECSVTGIASATATEQAFSNISVVGSITLPLGVFKIASGFESVQYDTKIDNIFVAISFSKQDNINLFYVAIDSSIANNVFIDCTLAGNNAVYKECSKDPKSQATADALGAAFGYKMEYNDGYPYLVNLPVWDGAKYVLPASGPFSAEFYYVDGLGYPFPNSDYQICRGACYGTYESPLVRTCTNNTNTTNNNSYCIQPELAETDFLTASCIHENAHCNSGASTCTSESELKLNYTDSTYICELGCSGCVNGHCYNSTCVCNLYHIGDHCSTYQCGSDSPTCFGDPTMECAADGSGCVPTDACAALGCVHGSCVVNSSNKTQCRCDNMWTGSRCDRCNAYGPECSVSYLECNRLCGAHGHCGTPLTTICTCSLGFGGANCGGCAAGHTAVGDSCVCGDSGGPCQLRQTCVDGGCVADCLLADPYCAECEAADQSVCARCVKQHTIYNGICQFHLSAAVSTSFAVVLGVAAAVASALGAVLLFRLLSAKRGGGKQKPVGDGVKLDAVQSGPKSVGKAEKPLLEQVPAIQDVNIEIKIDSARSNK